MALLDETLRNPFDDPAFAEYMRRQYAGAPAPAASAPPPPAPDFTPPAPPANIPPPPSMPQDDTMARFRAAQAADLADRKRVQGYARAMAAFGNKVDPRLMGDVGQAGDVAQENALRDTLAMHPLKMRQVQAGTSKAEAEAALTGAKVPYAGDEAAADALMKVSHAQQFQQQAAKGAADLSDAETFRQALRSGDSRATALVRHLAQKYGGMDVSGATGAEVYPMLPLLEKAYAAEQAGKARMLMMHGQTASLTPEAIENAAELYRRTGQLPALGKDAQSRGAIMNAAGAKGATDIASNRATLHADTSSLNKQQQLLDMTKAWEATGKANLGVLRGISQQLVNGGSPLANRPLRWLYQNAGGDPTVAKFHAAHAAVVNEYAKILSGTTSSAGVTDAARREAEGMIPLDATPAQVEAAANVLEQDAGNRLGAIARQVEETKGRISGKAPPAAKPDARARMAELVKAGKSKAEAIQIMQGEGY